MTTEPMDPNALSTDELAQRIAERGRDALVERLRGAYAQAAAAHADIVTMDDERIEALVQRSADNADLASGYANVVVLSPLGGRSRQARETGQFEGLRRPPEWGTDLDSQVEALRKEGSRVEVITPDTDSRAAMGTNQTDPATRSPAARAGFAQGKEEAARLVFI